MFSNNFSKNLLIIFLFISQNSSALVVDFDDLILNEDSFASLPENANFTSRGVNFTTGYDSTYGSWNNFTFSNRTDTTTPGYLNDRSAITGSGIGLGQDNYAVAYVDSYNSINPTINFNNITQVNSVYFTNTTYAYLAMKNGNDGYLGLTPFDSEDYFTLSINGLDQNGNVLLTQYFSLADDANVVDSWQQVDLSGLGFVYGLSFDLTSSDISPWGMNTPAYFAMDNLEIQPIPAPPALILFGSAILFMASFKRK